MILKIFHLTITAAFLLSTGTIAPKTIFILDGEAVTTVYICNSTTSSKYHYKKDCRGLNACKASIKAIEMVEAKKYGRTLCGWED